MAASTPDIERSSQIRKILFRFICIYFTLFLSPWEIFSGLPGISFLGGVIDSGFDWVINFFNDNLLHVKTVLVPLNGSGDTSYGWAALYTTIIISIIGSLVWTILDRRRSNYHRLSEWFRVMLRFILAYYLFIYGFEKLFALQMPFPSNSQMATPLGDLSPMRLAWMFFGYSAPYQIFSGVMEIIGGTFLLFRRTSMFGALVSSGVLLNVMMINLSYDVVVKIESTHLFLISIYLLSPDVNRLVSFFILNRTAASSPENPPFAKRWMRVTMAVVKILLIGFFLYQTAYYSFNQYRFGDVVYRKGIISGNFDVNVFCVNHDTIPAGADSLRWQDVVFDETHTGSLITSDTCFRPRYGRHYFAYDFDTVKKTITIHKTLFDTVNRYVLNYSFPDASQLMLTGMRGKDTLEVAMKKNNRQFNLRQKPFHWLSESPW